MRRNENFGREKECVDFGILAKRHFVLNPNNSRRDC